MSLCYLIWEKAELPLHPVIIPLAIVLSRTGVAVHEQQHNPADECQGEQRPDDAEYPYVDSFVGGAEHAGDPV